MFRGEDGAVEVENSTLNGLMDEDPIPTIIYEGIYFVPSSSIKSESVEEVVLASHIESQSILNLIPQNSYS